jgi:hypothetical protein
LRKEKNNLPRPKAAMMPFKVPEISRNRLVNRPAMSPVLACLFVRARSGMVGSAETAVVDLLISSVMLAMFWLIKEDAVDLSSAEASAGRAASVESGRVSHGLKLQKEWERRTDAASICLHCCVQVLEDGKDSGVIVSFLNCYLCWCNYRRCKGSSEEAADGEEGDKRGLHFVSVVDNFLIGDQRRGLRNTSLLFAVEKT